MAIYDIESLVFDIDATLRANINTEINAINTEKADGITIDDITTNAFAVQSLDENIDNFPNFVFTEVQETPAIPIGPQTGMEFRILTLVIASGTENELQSSRRMFRYGRALKQCIEKHWASSNKLGTKVKIEQIPPQDYLSLNASKKFKTVGLLISGSFVS